MPGYTNVAKPTSNVYTNLNPVGKEQYDDSGITYSSSTVFYDGVNQTAYTNLSKPTTIHTWNSLTQSWSSFANQWQSPSYTPVAKPI